jgi:pilus assembly protein FimV
MVKRLLPIFAVLALLAGEAGAVEPGTLRLNSSSGQPLSASIELRDAQGLRAEDIQVSIATDADFARFDLERLAVLNSLQIRVDMGASGGPVLLLSSSLSINEPFLSMVLDTRWPTGRVLTEYTLRLQTPAFSAGGNTVQNLEPVRTVLLASDQPAAAVEPAIVLAQTQAAASVQTPAESSAVSATSAAVNTAALSQAPAMDPLALSNSSTITVNAGDTLWELAIRVRPDSSISVQQTMLALQRLNPEAFIAGNINQVRRGAVLSVPELSEIRRLANTEAVQEVARQNQAFANRATRPQATAPAAAGTAPAAGAQGELRVVSVDDNSSEQRPDASAAGGQDAERNRRLNELEDRLAVRQEDLDRVDAVNSELSARLSMLQQQIASAQEIIRLRDLELARLQESLLAQGTRSDPVSTPEPAVVTLAPDASPFQKLLNTLINNTLALAGIALVLILILVLLLARRNKAARAAEQEVSRENDSMALGSEADELLFAGVAAAAAEAEAASKQAQRDSAAVETQDDEPAAITLDGAAAVGQDADDNGAEPAAPEQPAADASESAVAGDAADWGDTEAESAYQLDDEFDLDKPDESADTVPVVDPDEIASQAFDSETFASEVLGDELDWPEQEQASEDPGLADEFEISADDAVAPAPAEPAGVSEPADEFDDLAFIPGDEAMSALDDDDDDDFSFLSDSDEAATKLDLARAYIDMGDDEGAREILAEVLEEGTEAQRQDARALLERL